MNGAGLLFVALLKYRVDVDILQPGLVEDGLELFQIDRVVVVRICLIEEPVGRARDVQLELLRLRRRHVARLKWFGVKRAVAREAGPHRGEPMKATRKTNS